MDHLVEDLYSQNLGSWSIRPGRNGFPHYNKPEWGRNITFIFFVIKILA